MFSFCRLLVSIASIAVALNLDRANRLLSCEIRTRRARWLLSLELPTRLKQLRVWRVPAGGPDTHAHTHAHTRTCTHTTWFYAPWKRPLPGQIRSLD